MGTFEGKKRSELPDSVFGIPQERKYPMPDEKHTRSAIKLFNHVDPKYEEQLAKAVIKNMKKYGIDGSVVGPNNRLRKYIPKDMVNESHAEESSIPHEVPRDIIDLLHRLNSYSYGYIKNGKKIKGMKNFFEDYKSLTISEFEKYQIGVCWDYVHYEAYWFSTNNYKYDTFYIQVQDEDNDCPSHTYLVFYLPGSTKVYYFESSWGEYKGIEEFDNINKLHDTIKDRHIKSAKSKCYPKTYFRTTYDAKSSKWEHLKCGEYMVKISRGKVQINESVSSTVSPDHKQKGHIKLSSLKKVRITENIINKYKKEYPVLRHVRCKDTHEYICDGYMWFKENDLVCYVGSCQYTDDKTKWIVSLEIIQKYRGYGLSTQILDFCVKNMKCKYLSVNKNNELAKKIYDKYGFKTYREDKNMYYMTLDTIKEFTSSSNDASIYNKISENLNVCSGTIDPISTGISAVIFDIGDVLVSSNIKDYLVEDAEIPNEIIDELLKLWFLDKDDIDDTMTLDTYRDIVNKRMGAEFSKYIPKLFKYNVECVNAFKYTIPMIQDLKERGFMVYYLSNWSAWTHDLLQEAGKFDFLKLMDGGVFSYDVGCMKPDQRIYDILLKKYKIDPKKSIFVDDKKDNINVANKLKIHGVHFPNHDPSIVYTALEEISKSKIRKEVAESVKLEAQVGKTEIKDIKEVILSLDDDIFDNFKFKNMIYCDIRYRSKSPIAFIVIKNKSVNNCTVGCVSLAVNPKFQNKGIEQSLVEKVIQWFKTERGISFLEWNCMQNNETSKELTEDEEFKKYIAKTEDEYIKYTMESSIKEYGTTGGTMVGTNQPDSVYIVNYMQNNAFSGHKEPKFGICKKGMKDLHIVGGKYNRFHYVSDIDKFKKEASDIHVYRFRGKPKNEFYDIIEDMTDNDLDIYKLITGRDIDDRSIIKTDGDFVEEECFLDELDAIKACTEAGLLSASEDLHEIPILNETVLGRPYNFYRDINGVFIKNEITQIRSKSYESIHDIPLSEQSIVKKGFIL